MKRVKLTITIDTKKQLTEKQIHQAMIDFKYRIEGYQTEGLKFLADSNICMQTKYEREIVKKEHTETL